MPKIKAGISFPPELVHKINKDRKDVSYNSRCISKIPRSPHNEIKVDSLEVGFVGLVSSESMRWSKCQ